MTRPEEFEYLLLWGRPFDAWARSDHPRKVFVEYLGGRIEIDYRESFFKWAARMKIEPLNLLPADAMLYLLSQIEQHFAKLN
jgi:hypothetical protein